MSIKGLLFAFALSVLLGYMLAITVAPELPASHSAALGIDIGFLLTGIILLTLDNAGKHQNQKTGFLPITG